MNHGITRRAGVALLVYGIGTTAGFVSAGGPGGDFEPATIAAYTDPAHYWPAIGSWLFGALASLALLVVGRELRQLGGWLGEVAWSACIAATAISVTGAFVGGGLVVSLAEGGTNVQRGLGSSVVYTFSEIGNLLAGCGPAFFVGALAVVLAVKAPMPSWLRGFTIVAGVCGILAPLYFTFGLYLIWVLVFGIRAAAKRTAPSLADAAGPVTATA